MAHNNIQYHTHLSSSTFISELLRFRTNLLWVCNLLSAFLFTGFFTKVVQRDTKLDQAWKEVKKSFDGKYKMYKSMQPQFSLRHLMKEFLSCFQQTSTASIGQNNLTTRSKYHYVMHSKQSNIFFPTPFCW